MLRAGITSIVIDPRLRKLITTRPPQTDAPPSTASAGQPTLPARVVPPVAGRAAIDDAATLVWAAGGASLAAAAGLSALLARGVRP